MEIWGLLAFGFVLVIVFVVQVVLLVRNAGERARDIERIKAIRLPDLGVRVADLSAVDYAAEQPPSQMPHLHVWDAQPDSEDARSRTYRCQVPHCPRVHTVMR